MKHAACLLILSAVALQAQSPLVCEPEPLHGFNPVLRIMARSVTSGGKSDYSYRATWGSYIRDVKQIKDVEAELRYMKSAPLQTIVQCLFFGPDDQGKPQLLAVEQRDVVLPEGKPLIFSFASEYTHVNLRLARYHSREGNRMMGWAVRVIADGRVIAVAGSAHRFERAVATNDGLADQIESIAGGR